MLNLPKLTPRTIEFAVLTTLIIAVVAVTSLVVSAWDDIASLAAKQLAAARALPDPQITAYHTQSFSLRYATVEIDGHEYFVFLENRTVISVCPKSKTITTQP